MNLIKKSAIIGATACLGITLYASLGQSIGCTKAENTSANSLSSLTESAQNLSNFEMSINNLLLATNRINFINENIITVSNNYLANFQNSRSENSGLTNQTTQNNLSQNLTQDQNYSNQRSNRMRRSNTNMETFRTVLNSERSQRLPFANKFNSELERLNTNAVDVRNLLSNIGLETARNVNFNDYTKALNMAADNLNKFSETTLEQNRDNYPISKRLVYSSLRISNNALEEIKSKLNGNSMTQNSDYIISNNSAILNSTTNNTESLNSSTNQEASLTGNNASMQVKQAPLPRRTMTEYNR